MKIAFFKNITTKIKTMQNFLIKNSPVKLTETKITYNTNSVLCVIAYLFNFQCIFIP